MESDNHTETNVEIDDYIHHRVEQDLDGRHRVRSALHARRTVMAVCLALMIVVGVLIVVFTVGGVQSKTGENGGNKGQGVPVHLQEGGWVNDANGNKYQILGVYKRTSTHYTQGLIWDDGRILESGGLYGQSSIHYLNIDQDNRKIDLGQNTFTGSQYFGEGIDKIFVNGTYNIYQLTWRENKIFVYDTDLKLVKTLDKPSQVLEGWGLTHRPSSPCDLIISDSSDVLKVVDCNTMQVKESLAIQKGDYRLPSINELQFVDDYLVANVYLSKNIEIIDLELKKSIRTLDMRELLDRANVERMDRGLGNLDYGECLNGIAYDDKNKEFWITGKDWPLFFKIKFPEEYFKKQ